ncbi:beta-lactamase-like protein [Crucibulum laeve]|uniref:Beta-lactamase-like protein n=1 Tax=Crucibulum laeve TaxID=68775 RepID=A0A5C3MG67_9AGAR|nr:beta-lactamase-like protein [Crucibulum laeve]
MVDCAEGTYRQFQFQPFGQPYAKAAKVAKIFITHMHADHIMGIVPFLRNVLYPPPAGSKPSTSNLRASPRVEIYGPAGIRTFVRQNLKMTLTCTAETYVVHELLTANDPITPCDLPADPTNPKSGLNISEMNVLHACEVIGRDIMADADGLWRGIATGKGVLSNIIVDAGPIHHRDPCLGYVFTEVSQPNRKLVILGDTYDASGIEPLCINPSPSLLIHEATDAHIPRGADPTGKASKRTKDEVKEKVLLRGHSTPDMAGSFAKKISAERLVLNHISGRFPTPRNPRDARSAIIREIEKQASKAWGSQQHAIAAYDFLRITIPASDPPVDIPTTAAVDIQAFQESVDFETTSGGQTRRIHTESMSLKHANPDEGFMYASGNWDNNNRGRKRRR